MKAKRPPRLDQLLCFAIYSSNLAVTAAYKPLLARLSLTYPQYVVMLALWEEDGQSVLNLAQRVHMDAATLSPMLKRLEAAGLVTRVRSPQDERRVSANLTEKGVAAGRMAADVSTEFGNACALSGREADQLRSGLLRLRERLMRTAVGD